MVGQSRGFRAPKRHKFGLNLYAFCVEDDLWKIATLNLLSHRATPAIDVPAEEILMTGGAGVRAGSGAGVGWVA